MNNKWTYKITQLLVNGKLQEALGFLKEDIGDKLYVLLAAQVKQVKDLEKSGLVTSEAYRVENLKITSRILSILEDLDFSSKHFNVVKTTEEKGILTKPRFSKNNIVSYLINKSYQLDSTVSLLEIINALRQYFRSSLKNDEFEFIIRENLKKTILTFNFSNAPINTNFITPSKRDDFSYYMFSLFFFKKNKLIIENRRNSIYGKKIFLAYYQFDWSKLAMDIFNDLNNVKLINRGATNIITFNPLIHEIIADLHFTVFSKLDR